MAVFMKRMVFCVIYRQPNISEEHIQGRMYEVYQKVPRLGKKKEMLA
jgi:hypothetical protein